MNYEVKKFKLTGITQLLGSCPMNKELYSDFIATKAKTDEEKAKANSDVVNVKELDEKGITGFYRDKEGNIILKAYQIKGFFKEAAKALKDDIGMASTTSRIDNKLFIVEQEIPVMVNGEKIQKVDGYLERSLRCETMQGPRVSLAKSEMIEPGYELEITVRVLPDKKTAKSVPLDMSVVEQLLEYGEMKGLLQWRNGGYGSFTFEEIPME